MTSRLFSWCAFFRSRWEDKRLWHAISSWCHQRLLSTMDDSLKLSFHLISVHNMSSRLDHFHCRTETWKESDGVSSVLFLVSSCLLASSLPHSKGSCCSPFWVLATIPQLQSTTTCLLQLQLVSSSIGILWSNDSHICFVVYFKNSDFKIPMTSLPQHIFYVFWAMSSVWGESVWSMYWVLRNHPIIDPNNTERLCLLRMSLHDE